MADAESEAQRKEKLRQLFGDSFKDDVEKELSRVTKVEQPDAQPEAPEWMMPQSEGVQRLTLWLEAGGVNMDKIVLVQSNDARGMAVVTATDVAAGATLFDVPDSLLLTSEAAFADRAVGRDLRIMASNSPGAGFDTFAIAAMLAAERVRRGAVRGRLRRQDGGLQIGAINFATDGSTSELLPEWKVEQQAMQQSNNPFSPLISALPWPDEGEECLVEPERKSAVEAGAKVIARLIEPTARNAWMKATQRNGVVQATSEEDVDCRAVEALLLAIQAQLDPPPPIGVPNGARAWGGRAPEGAAICPLAHLVVPPSEADAAAAREAGTVNALLGRPTTGRTDAALRCVAARDLPAGTVVVTDMPGAPSPTAAAAPFLKPGARVRIMQGKLRGCTGKVVTLRPADRVPLVRLEGDDAQLVAVQAERLQPADTSDGDAPKPKKTRVL